MKENISMHLCVSLWVAHVLLIQYLFCYHCINCNWNSIYCNGAYFPKRYLALLCQQIISDKPLVVNFLGQQEFLSRQYLFCVLWWIGFKVCTLLVAYPLLLDILKYSNWVWTYLMHKACNHLYTYAPFVTLIRHIERFGNLTFMIQVATVVTNVLRFIVTICCVIETILMKLTFQ